MSAMNSGNGAGVQALPSGNSITTVESSGCACGHFVRWYVYLFITLSFRWAAMQGCNSCCLQRRGRPSEDKEAG